MLITTMTTLIREIDIGGEDVDSGSFPRRHGGRDPHISLLNSKGHQEDDRTVAYRSKPGRLGMSVCPKGFCMGCGKHSSGWSLAQKPFCECGGRIYVDPHYDVIVGFVQSKKDLGPVGERRCK